MVHVMMTLLESGEAVYWLPDAMVAAKIQVINESGGYFDRRRDIKLADMRLLGDPATRLKSVYTGSFGLPMGSIRIISTG